MSAAREGAPPPAVTREHVARGAALASLSRLGALIEVIAQPAYTWLFGLSTFGLYTVLWAAVNIVENVVDLGFTASLQRVVPTAPTREAEHGAVKFAILATVLPACGLAAAIGLAAHPIAGLLAAAAGDEPTLPTAIALFAWAIPLWTFVEIATSAARAKLAFGPEIRLRIFWEQVARLGFAAALAAAGVHSLGLVIAHLLSLAVTAALCVRLLGRYYDLRLLVAAPMRAAERQGLLLSGLSILPSLIVRRLLMDLPPVLLNLLMTGAAGADAAGLFGIARKIASIPLVVRQAFQYVLAPLSSAQAAHDRAAIAPLYRFAVRVSIALVVPLSGFLILIAADILSAFAPAARAALPLVVLLVLGRAGEAVVGPASPVVEMTGHRGLPLLNSAIGLGVWIALALWLVPPLGGVGMAIAVSAALVAGTWAAAVELRMTDGLSAFDRQSLRGLAVALAAVALLWAAGEAAAPAGARPRAILLLLLYPALTWIALRLGLARGDREALGTLGRRLRLA